MSDYYSEQIVKRKREAYKTPVKFLLIFLTAVFLVLGMVVPLFLIPTLAAGLGAYFFSTRIDIEFEYSFVGGELSIDKIMNKARRKKCITVDLEHTEVVAPLEAYQLDEFKNKQMKTYDFTSHEEDVKQYIMVAHKGSELVKIIFEPNQKLLNDMKNTSPRKVTI